MQNPEEIKEVYLRYLDKFQGDTESARKATRLYFEQPNQSTPVQKAQTQEQPVQRQVIDPSNQEDQYKENSEIGYLESLRNDLYNAWENTKNFVESDYPAAVDGLDNYIHKAQSSAFTALTGKKIVLPGNLTVDDALDDIGVKTRAEATRNELETQEKMLPSKSVVGSWREGDYLGSAVGMVGVAPDVARQAHAGYYTKGTSILAEMLSSEKLIEAEGIAEREGIPLEEAILKGSKGEDPRPYIMTGIMGLLERLGQVKMMKGISNAIRKGSVDVTNKFLKGLATLESIGWEGITEYLQELLDIGYEGSSKEDHDDANKELQSFLTHMKENYASDRTLDAFWKGLGGSGVLVGTGKLAGSIANKHSKDLDPDKVQVGSTTLTKEELAQAEAEEDLKYRQSIIEASDLRDIQKMVQNPVSVDEELSRLIQENDIDEDNSSTIRRHELDRLQKLNNLSGSFASIENPNMNDFKNLEEEFKKINSEARDAISSVFSSSKKSDKTKIESKRQADIEKQALLERKVQDLKDKRNALRGEDGTVSNENMAEWQSLNKEINEAAVKARRGDTAKTQSHISIKTKPKSVEESPTVLTGEDAKIAETIIEKIISKGIADGLSTTEIIQIINARYAFDGNAQDALNNYISDRNSNAPEIGNNKQSFPAWRKGKYDETKTEATTNKPKGSYNSPVRFITGDNIIEQEKASKTPVVNTNKASLEKKSEDTKDKKITDALDYIFKRTGSMRNKSNPMDRRLDKSRWDKILSALDMENAPTARKSRLRSYDAYYGEEIRERDPEVYQKIQDIIKVPEAEAKTVAKGVEKKETVSKYPAGMKKSDFENFDLFSVGIESDTELARAVRINQRFGEELSKDETYKDQAISLKDQITSYQKKQKDEFEKAKKVSQKTSESVPKPVEDSSEFDAYKESVNDFVKAIKNATTKEELNSIVKDNNLESKSKFEPVDIIKFKQAISDKSTEISKNKKKEVISKSLEERTTIKNNPILEIMTNIFGLKGKEAESAAAIADVLIEKMAERAGVSRADMERIISYEKSKLKDLPDGVKMQIDAWHGSPHQFDKFNIRKIGTGEGMQAFGWGLYFTELQYIARSYAEGLTLDRKYSLEGIEDFRNVATHPMTKGFLRDMLKTNPATRQEAISWVEKNSKGKSDRVLTELRLFAKILNIDNSVKRNLYKVSLHKGKTVEQYNWLDYMNPLSKNQIENLAKALKGEIVTTHKKTSLRVSLGGGAFVLIDTSIGAKAYNQFSKLLGGDKAASLFLLENGIDGIKYPAESRARDASANRVRGYNYVVFDENAVSIEETIKFQKDAKIARGAMMMAMDNKAIIYALEDANVSTPLHELSHVYEHYLTDTERNEIQDWAGTDTWTTETSEKFARGFEKYLSEGKAPTTELQKHFDNFKKWLLDIYNGIIGSGIDIDLNDSMRSIYNSMLTLKNQDKNEKQNTNKSNKQDTDTTKKQGSKLPTESRDEASGDTKVTEKKDTEKPLDSIVNNVKEYKFKSFDGTENKGNVSNVVNTLKVERANFFNKNRYANELKKATSAIESINKKMDSKMSKEELSANTIKNAQEGMRRLYDEWTSYIESQLKSLEKQGLVLSPQAVSTLTSLPGTTNLYFGGNNVKGFQLINDLFNSFFDSANVDENGNGSEGKLSWSKLSNKANNIAKVLGGYKIPKSFITQIDNMLKVTNGSISIIIGDHNAVKGFFLNQNGLEQHLEDNPGFFLPSSNGNHKIFINSSYVGGNYFQEILTHELAHAMSVGALRATEAQLSKLSDKEASAYRDFQASISALYDTIKADFRANNLGKDYPYSLSNIEEFFAHAQSNPALRDRMSNVIISDNSSALSRFFDTVIHFFERLGILTGNTALEAFDNIVFKFTSVPEFHVFNAMALEESAPLMIQNSSSASKQVKSIYNGLNNLAKDHRLTSKKFMISKLKKFYKNDASGIPRAKYLNSDRVIMQKITDRINNVSEIDARKEAIGILTKMGGLHSSKHRIDNPKFWEEVSELNSAYEKMEDKLYESLFYSQFYNPATSSYPESVSNMSDQIDTFLSTAKFKFRETTKQIKNDRYIKQSESLLRILGMNNQGIDIHDLNNEYNIGDVVFFRGKFFESLQDEVSAFPADGKVWKWRVDLNRTADQNIKKFDKSFLKGLSENTADFGAWVLTQSSGTPTILELMSIMERDATPYQNTYGTELFKQMERADNKKERILAISQKWIIDTQKAVYGNRWKRERNNRKFQTVQLNPINGKPFILTRGELYKKWMEFESPRTRKKLGMWAKERGMSYAEGKLLVNKTLEQFPKDKEWAMKQLTEFYPMMARYIDTAFKKHTGLSIHGMVENYSPISVKGTVDGLEFDITDVGKQDMHFATVYNAHLKGVVEGGTIQNIDGDRVMENYRKRMSHFVGYADVAGEVHSLSVNNTFKDAMDNLYGRKFFTTFEKMAKNIISGGLNSEVSDKIITRTLVALSTVSLFMNIPSALKQLLSLPAYPLDHPTGVTGWFSGFKNIPKVIDAIKVISTSQFMKTRVESGFSIMDESLARADYSDWRKYSGFTNFVRLSGRFGFLPSRSIDAITVLLGSIPLYIQKKAEYEKRMNSRTAKYEALIDVSVFANTTQQTSRNFATSAMDKDKAGRLFTQFQQAEIMYLSKAAFSVFRAGKKLAGGLKGYMDDPNVKKSGAIWNYISNDGGSNDIKRFVTYYWILPILFLWGSLGFDIGEEDEYEPEEDDKGITYRLYEKLGIDDIYNRIPPKIIAKIWTGSATGFPVAGHLLSLYSNKYIGGTDYEFNPSPGISTLEDMYDSSNKLITKVQDASEASDDGSYLGDTGIFMEEFLPDMEDEKEFTEFMEILFTPAALMTRANTKLIGRSITGINNYEDNKEEYGWLIASMLAVGATKGAVGLDDEKSASDKFINQLIDPDALEFPKTGLKSKQNSKK